MKGNAAARGSSLNTSRRRDTVQDSLRISEREFATGLSQVTIPGLEVGRFDDRCAARLTKAMLARWRTTTIGGGTGCWSRYTSHAKRS